MLSSLAIAVQGVGFGPAQIAVQGFLNIAVVLPPFALYDDAGGDDGAPAKKRELWMTMKILNDEREFVELLPLIMRVLL